MTGSAVGPADLQDAGMSLSLAVDPVKAIENARRCSAVLAKIIDEQELYTKIGKAKHIKNEAWLMVAHFYGITPRLVAVTPVYDEMSGAAGFEAVVEAFHIPSRNVIGQAAARCLNNEENWGLRPKYEYPNGQRTQVGSVSTPSYQLESMAQTRASSKVLSQLLRWVVILGGFDGTPAEEAEEGMGAEKTEKAKAGNGNGKSSTEKISDKERKQLFGAAKSHGLPFNDLPGFWQRHGFDRAEQITQDKFHLILKEIESYKKPTEGGG